MSPVGTTPPDAAPDSVEPTSEEGRSATRASSSAAPAARWRTRASNSNTLWACGTFVSRNVVNRNTSDGNNAGLSPRSKLYACSKSPSLLPFGALRNKFSRLTIWVILRAIDTTGYSIATASRRVI